MALSTAWEPLLGSWAGTNAFRLMPDDAYTSSPATLSVEYGPGTAALLIRYTWSHEGTDHRGLLLVTVGDEQAADAVWLDSFHQQPQWLALAGATHDDGRLELSGTFAEVWGWRILVDVVNGAPEIVMEIIPPGDEPYPVVQLRVDPR